MPRGRPTSISKTLLSDEPLTPEAAAELVALGNEPKFPDDQHPGSPQSNQLADHPPAAAVSPTTAAGGPHPQPDPIPPTPPAPSSDPTPPQPPAQLQPQTIRYKARIAIADAWQYPGQLTSAPPWIDRNWASWDDGGQLVGHQPGPALRIPVQANIQVANPSGEKLARVGDYIVRQEVTLAENLPPETTIDVWPKTEFEKLFLPIKERAKQPELS